ncbi:MAG: sigma-70 family RNA polymerase sigma factor [Solirubrobacterales bacterium]|nr:sigma-70 family RNA polymerase sigma factor [Solirubrobacterales bacterium]
MPQPNFRSEEELYAFTPEVLAQLFLTARRKGDVETAAASAKAMAWQMRGQLIRHAKNHTGADADPELIADQTISRALRGAMKMAQTFNGDAPGQVFEYMMTIQRRVIADHMRRVKGRESIVRIESLQSGPDDQHGPDGREIAVTDDDLIAVHIDDLTDQVMSGFRASHRQIIHMRHIIGYSSKETSDATGATVSNVDKVMERFRKALGTAYLEADTIPVDDSASGHNGSHSK